MVSISYITPSLDENQVSGKQYIEGSCMSTDTKPTWCAVGSIMVEVDTGDVYFYSGAAWVKQFSFRG